MDFRTILARINDVPNTFSRTGPPYTQIVDSLGNGMSQFTNAADATLQQVQNFNNASDAWLDVWGLLWGVPRQQNEANLNYSLRITRTVLAWVGTLPAIQQWLNYYATGGSVVENVTGLGYVLTLPASLSTAQVVQFLDTFDRIRPAGVPFAVNQVGGGLFLGTVAFYRQGTVQGAYLTNSTSALSPLIGAVTPNSVPLLPTLYFSDYYLGQPGLLSLINNANKLLTGIQPNEVVFTAPQPVLVTGLVNNGGVLQVINTTGWPTSATGLTAGQLWDAYGAVYVIPGSTPSPSATGLFYGEITSAQLLAIGGANLPLTDPQQYGQLWNNNGIVCVSL